MTKAGHEYWSEDKRFGVTLSAAVIDDILDQAKQSGSVETGGILIGRYNSKHSCAFVDQATGPPEDSKKARSWFVRGIAGLQALLNEIWRTERRYYLGEWHYHPGNAPTPSTDDHAQMAIIASSDEYACPEPILLILGGNPKSTWQFGVFVFGEDKLSVQLEAK